MCGIIGYIGSSDAMPVLLDGLKRLEYRGYDSAGIAVLGENGVVVKRTEGKLLNLENLLSGEKLLGSMGIGHTRWATHGRPSEINAHPHRVGDIVVVHNGIVENYIDLKKFLSGEGHKFCSETDTEVICHLIDHFSRKLGKSTFDSVREAVKKINGSFAIVVMNVTEPEKLYVAKRGSPLVAGEFNGEKFIASDIPALLPHTKDMLFFEDGDCAVVSRKGIDIFDLQGVKIERGTQHIPWNPAMAERGGFKHFMLKEIFEQSDIVQDVLAGRLDYGKHAVVLDETDAFFDGKTPLFDNITIIAYGTSYHAGLVGKYMIESLAKIPVSVDLASEFRYRGPLLDAKTLLIPISQSGETADTLAALKLGKELRSKVMSVCNVVGSSISRASDATLYTHAGPEIGVASTKAFTAQVISLYLLALNLGMRKGEVTPSEMECAVDGLIKLPRFLKEILSRAPEIKNIAESIADASHVLFIGRGMNYPMALEGALKLKEISYMHAEGFAGGELKHGPIALIDKGVPVVAIAPHDASHEKMLSNIEEVRARGALIISVTDGTEGVIAQKSERLMLIPKADPFISAILSSIPLQLLAYYVADHKGTDVDQPRNLAKSVTVE